MNEEQEEAGRRKENDEGGQKEGKKEGRKASKKEDRDELWHYDQRRLSTFTLSA